MYQNEAAMVSSGENSPDVKLRWRLIIIHVTEKNKILYAANYHAITLLYSYQKLERGTAISCNGHWMTFSMKDLIL
jgi:hypothetical protein